MVVAQLKDTTSLASKSLHGLIIALIRLSVFQFFPICLDMVFSVNFRIFGDYLFLCIGENRPIEMSVEFYLVENLDENSHYKYNDKTKQCNCGYCDVENILPILVYELLI